MWLCFSIVVVAERLLYTTTTSGLSLLQCFVFCVGYALLSGCAGYHKQHGRFKFVRILVGVEK